MNYDEFQRKFLCEFFIEDFILLLFNKILKLSKMIKIKRNSPSRIISDRSIISHSKSREKSSSGDDKKSNSSLKKKLYKHEIFDKRHTPSNFKTLHRIR